MTAPVGSKPSCQTHKQTAIYLYNLTGRVVRTAGHGIYIQRGNKVIMKRIACLVCFVACGPLFVSFSHNSAVHLI